MKPAFERDRPLPGTNSVIGDGAATFSGSNRVREESFHVTRGETMP